MTVAPALTVAAGPSVLDRLRGEPRAATEERLRLTVSTLTGGPCDLAGRELALAVADVVGADVSHLWLVRSVLGADLPTEDEMSEMLVRFRLGDVWAALAPTVERLARRKTFREVRVVVDGITCDVGATSRTERLSGIQRVVREVSARWRVAHPDVVFVGWINGYTGMRELTEREHTRVFEPGRAWLQRDQDGSTEPLRPAVVPWRGLHLVPELCTQFERVPRMLALLRHSGLRVADIGYDLVPVTSAATTGPGMVQAFAGALAPRRYNERIAAISDAAASEYRGWVGMCAGRGNPPPEVASIPLPAEAKWPTDEEMERARLRMKVGTKPLVLVVGSHEPRKNHLAVLHAAEVLWREGADFTLTFVGAAAWRAEAYDAELTRLQRLGRPVQSLRALPDDLLWAAYRLAHCTIFPSLNEGFGLPVAESLAAGTPVITSDFGSMRDIVMVEGEPLGGLLVDTRDDESIIDALRTLLSDGAVHDQLKADMARRPTRSWDDYASELWDYLVHGRRPGDPRQS